MKLTLSWLKDHLETDATLDEIVERLTSIGLEVESVDDKAALKPFVIARVLSAEQHPDADRLRVLMVDIGSGIRTSGWSAPSPPQAHMSPASIRRSASARSAASRVAA